MPMRAFQVSSRPGAGEGARDGDHDLRSEAAFPGGCCVRWRVVSQRRASPRTRSRCSRCGVDRGRRVRLVARRAVWPFLLLPLWLFLRMALNAIDGMLAREFGQQSALGAYLNELSDVVSDAALYLPFAQLAPFGVTSVGLVILLVRAVRNGGRARADGRRAAPLRRADGQERPRVRVRRARAVRRARWTAVRRWRCWIMPVIVGADRGQHRNRVRRGVAQATAVRTETNSALVSGTKSLMRQFTARFVANAICGFARLITGARALWKGGPPKARPAHLLRQSFEPRRLRADLGVAAAEDLRVRTRPVAGADYWNATKLGAG